MQCFRSEEIWVHLMTFSRNVSLMPSHKGHQKRKCASSSPRFRTQKTQIGYSLCLSSEAIYRHDPARKLTTNFATDTTAHIVQWKKMFINVPYSRSLCFELIDHRNSFSYADNSFFRKVSRLSVLRFLS